MKERKLNLYIDQLAEFPIFYQTLCPILNGRKNEKTASKATPVVHFNGLAIHFWLIGRIFTNSDPPTQIKLLLKEAPLHFSYCICSTTD